jgi:LacI family transcriptional regulator
MTSETSPGSTRKKRVTLRDVAESAGVHVSTASRVINNPEISDQFVSKGVAAKIRNIADEMGYRLNPFGYGLRTNRSAIVGVVIPTLTNPVFPSMIRGIEHRLRESGYTAILADSDQNEAEEKVIAENMRMRSVDGLILATALREDPVVKDIQADGTPLVLVNRTTDDSATSVTNDDVAGIRLAVEHLAKLGHHSIAYLSAPQDTSTGLNRHEGFLTAIREFALDEDPALIHSCDSYSIQDGRAGTAALLDSDKDFTAIIAANDMMALGACEMLGEHGLSCPGDISVVGYNDMPFADKFNPPLTTLNIDHYDMGRRAAETLLSLIKHPENKVLSQVTSPRLVVRGSTGKAAH